MSSFRINRSSRGNLGFFLTSDTDDKAPREHAVLKAACDAANAALKESKIRTRNFREHVKKFDQEVVGAVKLAIQESAQKALSDEGAWDRDNKEFLESLQDDGSAFSYTYAVIFACMKRYADDIDEMRGREANKENEEEARENNRRDAPRREAPRREAPRQDRSEARPRGEPKRARRERE
jgi:hypothetical protein